MCGRFTQHHSPEQVAARFDVPHPLFAPDPRYNIAPTQTVAAIVSDTVQHERYLDAFFWGLIPEWAKDSKIASKMINARAETIQEKPAFRDAFKYRRCIVPADGFYEWDKRTETKQPYHFRLRDGDLFGFAGIWSKWTAADGSEMLTCSILTTSANDLVNPIHDRMPVILQSREDEARWLDDRLQDPAALRPLLAPFPAERMEAIRVGRRVGSPLQEDAGLILPVS